MIEIDKPSEKVDYELIPADNENQMAWDIRFIRGEFTETVIRYGNISFDGHRDCLTFNFKVISTPIDGLSSEDEDLQKYAADVLEDVIANSIADGSIVMKERED